MASPQLTVIGWYLRLARRRTYAERERGLALLARAKGSSAPPRSLRRRCEVTSTVVDGFTVHTVRPRGSATAGSGPVVVYLHGGAYVSEIVSQHWSLVGEIAERLGCEVQVPIYGLAPDHDGLEARRFVVAVLERIAAEGRPVHLAGDSAGAGLALIAAQAVLAEPGVRVLGLSLVAPWLDLTMANPGIDAVERIDPWLARPGLRPVADAWANGLPLGDPRVSPVNGELDGLPPVHLLVGTRDITLADCRLLRERLPAASLAAYDETPEGLHVMPLLPAPEGRADRRRLLDGISESLTRAPARD